MARRPATPCAEALRLHAQASDAEEAGYIDPTTGLFVLTSWYLREQGSCCGAGCRHCPWDEAEQRRGGRDPQTPAWPHPPR